MMRRMMDMDWDSRVVLAFVVAEEFEEFSEERRLLRGGPEDGVIVFETVCMYRSDFGSSSGTDERVKLGLEVIIGSHVLSLVHTFARMQEAFRS